MKKFNLSIIFAFVFCTVVTMLGFSQECEAVRNDVFRLHILANSDSEYDQNLKLKVRDEIIKLSEDLFKDSKTKEDAIKAAEENIEVIKECAENELRRNGSDYNVEIEIGESFFDTREYGDYTLPAGKYPALRVLIGEAKGKNWWCVMFPQLCLPTAQPHSAELFTDDETALITNGEKYEIRFKCVEYYEKLKAYWEKH